MATNVRGSKTTINAGDKMKATFSFKGWAMPGQLTSRDIGRVRFDDGESLVELNIGDKKMFKDDVPVKVTVTVERIARRQRD